MSAPLSPAMRRALARVSHTWESAAALHVSERSLWALERRALVEATPLNMDLSVATGRITVEHGGWGWRLLRHAVPRPEQAPGPKDSAR